MLRWISILGGLLIMMGHHARSEALFYNFRLEDQVPENHLLRLIDNISFDFVRQQLKNSYRETGRPPIDPELLLRILLIGYLYGITSERQCSVMVKGGSRMTRDYIKDENGNDKGTEPSTPTGTGMGAALRSRVAPQTQYPRLRSAFSERQKTL